MTEHEFFLKVKEYAANYPSHLSRGERYSYARGYRDGHFYCHDVLCEMVKQVESSGS